MPSWITQVENTLARQQRLPFREPWGYSLRAQELNARLDARGVGIDGWRFDWPGDQIQPELRGHRVVYERPGGIVEWYEAGSGGIEQGFDVHERPLGDLVIEGRIRTRGAGRVEGDEAIFPELRVRGLRAWDAAGKSLPARMEWRALDRVLAYRIADGALAEARFPIVVDPLFASPTWSAEPDQGGAGLGTSVASAGDVNGDGHADVIVGAPDYTNGEAGEGRAFLYFGSPAGPSLVADWTYEADQAGAHLGVSVASAGDVDGDGFGDVIVGADLFDGGQADEGAAFVFLGSPSGPSASPDWAFEADQADAHLGVSVASAGDVDGDGFGDVIVGAELFDAGEADEGRAFVFLGSAGGLSLAPDWTAEADQADAHLGASVASAGDVNGDGYGDVIVGAPDFDNVELNEGTARVYLGSALGLDPAATWSTEADQADAHLGAAVASAGDVDGDGFGDVIIGAPDFDSPEVDEGAALVYLGSPTGPTPAADWTLEADQAGARLGASVSAAGDINGDGFADVGIGTPLYDDGETDEGRVSLYVGSAAGIGATPTWTFESNQDSANLGGSVAWAGDVDGDGIGDLIAGAALHDNGEVDEGRALVFLGYVEGPDPVESWSVTSGQGGAQLGVSVASAGDVNGDGFSDVIAGAPEFTNGNTREGVAQLFFGSAAGLSLTPDWSFEADQASANLGISVASAGDVNGDGYDDVIVGAEFWDGDQADEGAAFLFLGSPAGPSLVPDWTSEPTDDLEAHFGFSVASAGDVNGDGYADVIVGADDYDGGEVDEGAVFLYLGSAGGLSLTPDWTFESNQPSSHLGFSAASAGDTNGDGFDEIVVGSPDQQAGNPGEGLVFVFAGSPTGPASAPTWTIELNEAGARLGSAVASAGDVNGDGFGDVIVGAEGHNNGQPEEGGAFLFEGSLFGPNLVPSWQAEANQISAFFGVSVDSAGDVNGDGFTDVIVGADTYDAGQSNEGRAFVFYGSSSGPSLTADWTAESNQIGARFGHASRGAGDVNGDGFGDLIMGADNWNGPGPALLDEGKVFVYLGGDSAPGLDRRLRQYRADGTTRIGVGGDAGGDTVVLEGRVTQEGGLGGMLRLEVEVRRLGAPFDGTRTFVSPLAPAGSIARVTVPGLIGPMHWRARVVYPTGSGWGRWVSFGANAESDADFLTPRVGDGSACEGPSECGSGFCEDAICCSAACRGNCDRCDLPGSIGTCVNHDASCTGSCDQCVAGNCVAVPSSCSGTCVECVGGGTEFSCAATPSLCGGDCAECNEITPVRFDCSPNAAACMGNCASCECVGATCACGADDAACTGNCALCVGAGGSFSCAADTTACTGNCGGPSACTGGGTEFSCAGAASACSGNCARCACTGVDCQCEAIPSACTGDCAECAGGGTSFSCSGSEALCPAICDHCDGAATDFSCVPLPLDGSPDADCGAAGPCQGECDGLGVCAYPDSSLTCGPATCVDSIFHPADTCDGAGGCTASTDVSCTPYACNASETGCRTSCTLNSHCASPFVCARGECLPPNGTSCSTGDECASGHCVDGVCCDSACDGLCRACDLPSMAGTCSAVAADGVADAECPGSGECQGDCDGNRGCAFPGSEASCGTCRACDGRGGCTVTPVSDPACGTTNCSGLDDACRAHSSLQGVCVALGECAEENDPGWCNQWTARNEGEVCHAGGCADTRTCQEGACVAIQVTCSDEDACTTDSCDEETGECVFTPIEDCGSTGSDGCGCVVGATPEPSDGAIAALMFFLLGRAARKRRRRT